MVCVRNKQLHAEHFEVIGRERFDRPLRRDSHERGGVNRAVRGGEGANAGARVGGAGVEGEG
jgi:hypothetical protein